MDIECLKEYLICTFQRPNGTLFESNKHDDFRIVFEILCFNNDID